MQPDYVKRRVEREIVDTMKKYPGGRDTRKLISEVLGNLQKTYPSLNRYHVAGMLAWILQKYNFSLTTRYPGFMVSV
jgi:hypothetical protein